ncbi:MAG: SRPBCC family protein [Chloroflexota bacterium]
MRVEKDITVNAPVDRVYKMWTDFENFPSFMDHVISVKKTGDDQLHWVAKIGPITKEWDAEVRGLVENRTVTWRSKSGAENAGAVTLAERGNLTEMHVVIEYEPTWLETIGDAITGALEKSVEDDLEHFKRLAEGRDPSRADGDTSPSMGESGAEGNQILYSKQRKD